MYSVDSLQDAIERLFYDGVGEHDYTEAEVKLLLECIDYEALLQAVRHNAQTVHTYTTQGKAPKSFNYRGGDLFGQRATLLYDEAAQSHTASVIASRIYELWLLEDMTLTVVACVGVDYGNGEYVTKYREIKHGDPWESGMYLDLDELSTVLFTMWRRQSEGNIPIYEL